MEPTLDIVDLGDLDEDDAEEEEDVPIAEDTETAEENFEVDFSTDEVSLDQVIPEGFEAGIEDAPASIDDELEAEEEITVIEAPAEKILIHETDVKTGSNKGAGHKGTDIPVTLKNELRTVLSYMDQLLESLPEEKIEEFAKSEYFDSYKKLFKELGLI
jgi:hypothetical protein